MGNKRKFSEAERALFKKAGDLYKKGKIKEALPILKSLYESNPTSPAFTATLANTFWDLGDTTKAGELFSKAVDISPKSELTSLGLFHLLWEKGKRGKAVREIERFSRNSVLSDEYLGVVKEINQTTDYSVDVQKHAQNE